MHFSGVAFFAFVASAMMVSAAPLGERQYVGPNWNIGQIITHKDNTEVAQEKRQYVGPNWNIGQIITHKDDTDVAQEKRQYVGPNWNIGQIITHKDNTEEGLEKRSGIIVKRQDKPAPVKKEAEEEEKDSNGKWINWNIGMII
ncbi:hypothetical protein Malapachy_0277 [Malassezia pachydermatis]|uniref:Uncharacterized protein n=1 Tax=Malassezia pachydermatis TaxID=77020 RepID=A0A0M8MIS7_9BASI|nr:hypothetical protein Malapachy_0277 [Malassezia pachydermatis]KOS13306.1 hypothetical protein Malapachy_0277 [Malassezia pachydermatis]